MYKFSKEEKAWNFGFNELIIQLCVDGGKLLRKRVQFSLCPKMILERRFFFFWSYMHAGNEKWAFLEAFVHRL